MAPQKKASKKKKNSLVENINRRKRSGKSRPEARSTVSRSAYRDMQQGWPKRKKSSNKKQKKSNTRKKDSPHHTAARRA